MRIGESAKGAKMGSILRKVLMAAAPFIWRKYKNRKNRGKDDSERR